MYLACVMWIYVLLRADSDRAAPHANASYHGKGVPAGHAGGASARPQHRTRHVPLPGPADQDTFPFPITTSLAAQRQPTVWIQPQFHHSPAGGHSTRAGDCYAFSCTHTHQLSNAYPIQTGTVIDPELKCNFIWQLHKVILCISMV